MQKQAWILAGVVAVVVGVLSFWIGRRTAAPAPAPVGVADVDDVEGGEALEPEAAMTLGDTGGALSASVAREAFLLREIETERGKIDALEAEVATLKERIGAESEGGEPAGASATHARFVYAGAEKALQGLDLDGAGESLSKMTPLIHELLDSIVAGAPRMELQQDIGRLNAELIGQAVKIQGSGLTGEGINGVFTHPAIQVNYIYAALLAAEQPLTEKQEQRLQEIGDQFVRAEKARVSAYGADSFTLQKLAEEADLKTRFYAAVDEMLTSVQRDVLHPESMRGRMRADLFSSGLIWVQYAGPLRFKDREGLARSMGARVMRQLQLGSDQESLVNQLAQDYVAAFSDAFLDHTPDVLDKKGLLLDSRVLVAAHATVGFLKALVDHLPLDDAVRARIRKTAFVLVPLRAN